MVSVARKQHGGRRNRTRGFALILTLLLIMVMTVLCVTLQSIVSREVRQTANARDDTRAAYLAEMGLIRGQVMLRLDEHPEYDSLNEIWAKAVSWEGETFGEDAYYDDYGEGGSGRGAAFTPPQVLIVDEERKFNILTLVRGNREQREASAEVLKRLINICRRMDDRLELDGRTRIVRRLGEDSTNTDTLVRNLIRYLEERPVDEAERMEFDAGPEEDYDQRRMKKQSPFEMLTIGELLLAEGWTRQLLYGPPRVAEENEEYGSGRNGTGGRRGAQITAEEEFEEKRRAIESVDERSRSPDPIGLIHFITLYSTGRININTAPREVLLALDPDLTWETVERIVIAREQDRRDVEEAEETGQIPTDQPPEGEEEAEDLASFRPQDIANFQAFVNRVNNQTPEEGQQLVLENFTAEIFGNMRPWLTVTSSVFTVESSATVDKVTHTLRAVYRRSNVTPQQPQQPPQGENQPPPTAPTQQSQDEALPPQPDIRLTLLSREVTSG
jgi:type II secretory pathway component PulK